ncbi:MAG: hypothetical protein AVDCRST_MAG31-2220, partial [uncultured Sphingomonas sp.]
VREIGSGCWRTGAVCRSMGGAHAGQPGRALLAVPLDRRERGLPRPGRRPARPCRHRRGRAPGLAPGAVADGLLPGGAGGAMDASPAGRAGPAALRHQERCRPPVGPRLGDAARPAGDRGGAGGPASLRRDLSRPGAGRL